MRLTSWGGLVLVLAAGAPALSTAGQVGTLAGLRGCEVVYPTDGELLVAGARGPGSPGNDLFFDFTRKGGRGDGLSLMTLDGVWWITDAWREAAPATTFAVVTMPPEAPRLAGRIYVDSETSAFVDCGAAAVHRVGESLPVGYDAGIGLEIPGTRTTYRVTTGALDRDFPERSPDGAVTVAFAPIPEVSDVEAMPGCATVGGRVADPSDPAPNDAPPVAGRIVGYNVYRIPACASTTGGRLEFMRALADISPRTGWIGFVDLRRFRLSEAHDGSVSPGPNDLDATDAVELVNPDGRMYSGDEVILFTDRAATARPDPARAPRPDQAYFYAVQPVWRGTIDEYADASFTVNRILRGDHRRDLDRDGSFDAVDIDLSLAGGVELISPQHDAENGALDGLGLTAGGALLLSAPMFADALVRPRFPPECLVLPRP